MIVNRGFVPIEKLDPATRPDGQIQGRVTITGLMREPEARNLFTPNDDPTRNQWFTRDPAAIAAFLHLDDAAPFSIDQDASAIPGGLPQGGETVLDIPNNHLSYALHLVRPGGGPPRGLRGLRLAPAAQRRLEESLRQGRFLPTPSPDQARRALSKDLASGPAARAYVPASQFRTGSSTGSSAPADETREKRSASTAARLRLQLDRA